MTREQAETTLNKVFQLPKFYDEQWTAIERILRGERVLLIEKTGFGKSLCFQFPAIISPGLTIIFSPLIALMRDQVNKLKSLGIAAECINSEQTLADNNDILERAKAGELKILYIAPERQDNNEWFEATMELKISMLVIDEAHCISVWGHDFRPSYRRIINLVKLLPAHIPVLATTATATLKVQKDIEEQIGHSITTIRGNLLRNNLGLFVLDVKNDDEKMIWLGQNIPKFPGSGIIYTGTRYETEVYSNWFEHLDIPSVAYNAGLPKEERIEIEKGLMNNKWKCIISTNALGMGIDKSDIRFIIHTQFPQSPIHYYQEIGRAGRDGKHSYIILCYNPEDKDLPIKFIEQAKPPEKQYHKVISAIKEEMFGERDLMRKTNLRQTPIRVIRADLIDQKIAREIIDGRAKLLEYIPNAPELDYRLFEQLKQAKLHDLDNMIRYAETKESRMRFLCNYLGDSLNAEFKNCDNTGLKKPIVAITNEWSRKLEKFKANSFPIIEYNLKKINLISGVAGSYYGFSNIGATIHKCKYENGGEYPQQLVDLTVRAFYKQFRNVEFDLVLYVPPTKSGNLVKNFAEKVAEKLQLPLAHNLRKSRDTKQQKILENVVLKSDNVKNAFVCEKPNLIKGRSILIIDDIFDSGATIKEIGRYLTELGAEKIAPLVIAKTIGGDI